MNHQAIFNLYPNVVTVDDTAGAMDKDGNKVPIVQSDYEAEVARLQAEYDSQAYARARKEAYPSWQEQMDMMFHDQTEGSRTWLDAIEAVKEAYPK
jgi:phytoene dehydrogenase-like protein